MVRDPNQGQLLDNACDANDSAGGAVFSLQTSDMPLSSCQAAVDESLAEMVQSCVQFTVLETCYSKLLREGEWGGGVRFGLDCANHMICTMYHSNAMQSSMLVSQQQAALPQYITHCIALQRATV